VEVGDISTSDVIRGEAFNNSFEGLFNTIRIDFEGQFNIETLISKIEAEGRDYAKAGCDSKKTRCWVSVKGFDKPVTFTGNSIIYKETGALRPVELFQGLSDRLLSLRGNKLVSLPGESER
jgi:hypothetical protein